MQGLIPKSFIDDVLVRTDLIELIDHYVPLTKRGHSHVACCPFHTEKSPSFNVSAKKQVYYCFGCGEGGNAVSFVMKYLHQSYPDAIETLATRLGWEVPRDQQSSKQYQAKLSVYELMAQVAAFYAENVKSSGSKAKAYLQERGVSDAVIETYQLGYAPDGWRTLLSKPAFKDKQRDLLMAGMLIQKDSGTVYDRYRDRIMFPIHNRKGHIVGFGGRVMSADQEPKYLNSPETTIFQKKNELYGLYQVIQAHQTVDAIWVVEGYMDVIALAVHGIQNAVATLGTATGESHIHVLMKVSKTVVFCFDGDAAGQKAAWRALESCLPYLDTGLEAHFVFLPDGEDPDSFVSQQGQAAFLALKDDATPLHTLLLDTLSEKRDLQQLADRAALVNDVKPYLQKIPDCAFKQLLMETLSRLVHMDIDRLAHLIHQKREDKAVPQSVSRIARTPLRIAMALLLQQPHLYQACAKEIEPHLDHIQKDMLLFAIIQKIQAAPDISTGVLLETWRDSEQFGVVNKLANWDPQVPETDQQNEFVDIIRFLANQSTEKSIQVLLDKSRRDGLTRDEKVALQKLLKARHRVKADN